MRNKVTYKRGHEWQGSTDTFLPDRFSFFNVFCDFFLTDFLLF